MLNSTERENHAHELPNANNTLSDDLKAGKVSIFQHISSYEQLKFKLRRLFLDPHTCSKVFTSHWTRLAFFKLIFKNNQLSYIQIH